MPTYNFYYGTSGLVLPFPKKDFPTGFQNSSRLNYYASLENSIEINSSFYRLPMINTVKKWANELPGNFQFTFKLWKEITHQKNLEFKNADVEKFMDIISQAQAKVGCILVQFPPSLQVDALPKLDQLIRLVQLYETNKHWNIAVEFRHRSWYQDHVYELLRDWQAVLVIHDMPASATPVVETSDQFIYLRFHGPDGRYKGSYDDEFLSEYATYIIEWINDGKIVYVYFNNTAGDALNNLNYLKSCVNKHLKQ